MFGNTSYQLSLIKTIYCGGGAYSTVSASRSYRDSRRELVAVQSAHAMLSQWLSANRSEMRSKAIESFKKEVLPAAMKWSVK